MARSPYPGSVFVNAIACATTKQYFTREYAFGDRLGSLALADADARGTTHVGVYVMRGGVEPNYELGLSLVCLSTETGEQLGRIDLPVSAFAGDIFRRLAVFESGGRAARRQHPLRALRLPALVSRVGSATRPSATKPSSNATGPIASDTVRERFRKRQSPSAGAR